MSKAINLAGQRFGRLTAIKVSGKDKNGRTMWLCKCDCGNETIVMGYKLTSKQTKSCGCLVRDKIIAVNYKHGGTGTRLHNLWFAMKTRCYNKNSRIYPYYGGRGIKICDEWLSDFSEFRSWAISNGYRDNLSIDRIDNNGNYEPSNCRWITQKQQSRNTRRCQMIAYEGKSHCMSEWADILGVDSNKLTRLLQRNGYDAEKVFPMINKEEV